MRGRRLRAGVFVLGDIGRSPRMQYHAAMLLRTGADVEVIALRGKEAISELAPARMTLLPALELWTAWRAAPLAVIGAALRAFVHFVLASIALRRAALDLLIVQTPPALPSLAVAALLPRRTRVIVDWHNVTADVARPRVGRTIASFVAFVERRLGRRFAQHLAVSDALAARLHAWGVKAMTFRDAPWLEKLPDRARGRALLEHAGVSTSPVAITATSWSRDEDFVLLLDALKLADAQLSGAERLTVVITGDGPGRGEFLDNASRAALQRVTIVSAWFAPADFLDALSAADLAVSLHRSVSGLDLPMKLFDFEAAGLPVAVLDYGAVLREIDGTGWQMFRDAESLVPLLLDRVRGSAGLPSRQGSRTWSGEWLKIVRPLLGESP